MASHPVIEPVTLVVFRVEQRSFALHLSAVDHVLWMMEILPLPMAPGAICGLLNYHDRVVPVADLRRRMGWRQRFPVPSDRILLTRDGPRPLALMADAVDGVIEVAAGRIESASALVPSISGLQSLTTVDGEVILIQDLNGWLTADEESFLRVTLADGAKS